MLRRNMNSCTQGFSAIIWARNCEWNIFRARFLRANFGHETQFGIDFVPKISWMGGYDKSFAEISTSQIFSQIFGKKEE